VYYILARRVNRVYQIYLSFAATFGIGVNPLIEITLNTGWLLALSSFHLQPRFDLPRWTQGLRYPSSLVQTGRTMNPVVGRCHRLGQEEDLNRSRAWNAEELSSSSLPSNASLPDFKFASNLFTT